MHNNTGFLIALEGIDGSGTTTQARLLGEYLKLRRKVVCTVEPSKGPIGILIRQALVDNKKLSDESLALLFAADRLDHIEREIEPALKEGNIVITDRYLLSSLAYQSSYLPIDWVLSINSRARKPDASILLRVSAETAARRRETRGGHKERFDDIERQGQIAQAYEQTLKLANVGLTYAINAENDVETVHNELKQLLDKILP
ncbi:MAG: dTMP kinase [Deltaproteobacteria bacterium]|nr:dTMP kinase [Deltaproteobacteria bacterium]